MTLATALAAPVDDGMMLPDAARPPRQSFFEEPSTAGAENTTFLAPAFKCGCTFSVVKNTPVDSHTYSAPCSLNGISAGSRVWDKATFLPSITRESPSASIVPSYLPWMESYFIW